MSELWPIRLRDEAQRAEFWPSQAQGVVHQSPEADAFALGLEEGRRTVEAEVAGEREALLQLAASLEALEAPSVGLLATLMVAAVEALVIDIAGNALVDAALLAERAEAIAGLIASETEAVLNFNPEDFALLGDRRFAVRVASDAELPRGCVSARVGGALIEDGVASALTRLRGAIAQMGIAS